MLLLAVSSPARAQEPEASEGTEWRLELDSKYDCQSTRTSDHNADTHKGSITFRMPEESGRIDAAGGPFTYHVIGRMGNGQSYEFTTSGTLTLKGEVAPGRLSFTPQVVLPDGRSFYDPMPPFEMPIYDGAVYEYEPSSNADVICEGYVRYTLRGKPVEKYSVLIDDRYFWGRTFAVYEGRNWQIGITLRVLTEIGITVQGEKVSGTTGSRWIGRVTPDGDPPGVWIVSELRGRCSGGGNYPYVPPLSGSQVSASVRNETTIALSVPKGEVGVAARWVLDPDAAMHARPGVTQEPPKRFDGHWCADIPMPVNRWSFRRHRNSVTKTWDTFDHFQIFTVTQQATSTFPAPAATTGRQVRPVYFGGDADR